jgi:hypothetical protein
MYNKVGDIESGDYERQLMRNINNPEEFMRILNSIPQKPKPKISTTMCAQIIVVIILAVFMLPFGITNLYYAYTDDSCVNLPAGRLAITLKDFLLVDGYYILITYVLVSVHILVNNIDKKSITDNIILIIISFILKAFSLSWLILGAIMFWKLIDNTACDNGIYNYMYAMLIIKFSLTALDVFSNNKKDN